MHIISISAILIVISGSTRDVDLPVCDGLFKPCAYVCMHTQYNISQETVSFCNALQINDVKRCADTLATSHCFVGTVN